MNWKKTSQELPEASSKQYLCYYEDYDLFSVLSYECAIDGNYWYVDSSFARQDPDFWCELPETPGKP